MELLTRPRGTVDVLPAESWRWAFVEGKAKETAATFGFAEIRTPTFEFLPLYERGVGDTTDVVQKEMYTFADRRGRMLALRPESTAGVMRALLEAKLSGQGAQKLYYLQSHFRYERPQAGRMREHHQFGVELVGVEDAAADAEVIALAHRFLGGVGLDGLVFSLNSIGCSVCRPRYREALLQHLRGRELCEDDAARLERNPLRVLDCKTELCAAARRDAPKTLEYLCADCRAHFESLIGYLQDLGIHYVEDPSLVRGLDYYRRTVFEAKAPQLGAQSTVCGGGRYDGLAHMLGGQDTPGIGFGLGLERLLLALETIGAMPPAPARVEVYIATLSQETRRYGMRLAAALREHGIRTDMALELLGMRAQLRRADGGGARYAVIMGPRELQDGAAVVRDMQSGEQVVLPLDGIAQWVASRIKEGKA